MTKKKRQHNEEEEDIVQDEVENSELSDFEVTDGEEEDIFLHKYDECIRDAREASTKWFQTWDESSKSKVVGDNMYDSDEDPVESDGFWSLDSEGDDSEGEPRRVRRRYPEWREITDLKEKVELKIGMKFVEPTQFKEVLKLFPVQNGFDYIYLQNKKARVTAACKTKCGW